MHAGKDVKFLTEQCFEALFALVAGIDFYAPIFDHSQLIFELFCIGGVAVHELFESADFCGVAFEALANFVFEVFDFNILVEVGEEVLDFYYFALLGQFYHIADSAFFDEEMLGDLNPQLFALVLVLRPVSVLSGQIFFAVF